jgi:hypothetical protein
LVLNDRALQHREAVLPTPERGDGISVQQRSGDQIVVPRHGTRTIICGIPMNAGVDAPPRYTPADDEERTLQSAIRETTRK